MKKFLGALFGMVLCASVAAAQPAPNFAIHNGSLMTIEPIGKGSVVIRYAQPTPYMASLGVTPGVVLLSGQWIHGILTASANVFSAYCGRAYPYAVTGSVNPQGVLTLVGKSPVIDSWCRMIGLAWSNNSTLSFVPLPLAQQARPVLPVVPGS